MFTKHHENGNDHLRRLIQSEINRFQSVHPNIYLLYEFLDNLEEMGYGQLSARMRMAVESIECAFIGSPEWTLSRNIHQIRLGVLGLPGHASNKSLLVNRFLTGAVIHDDSCAGGRFKRLMTVEAKPYMLLIRDEAHPPSEEFSKWVDVVMFVFSVENEDSFQTIVRYHHKITKLRNSGPLPFILTGTLDTVNAHNPRTVDARRAHMMVQRCAGICLYIETHSMCGSNVDRVFDMGKSQLIVEFPLKECS
ncbi:hypothetical protein ACOME3_007963 [Neoechinorhynchus agilis]